MSMSGTSGMSMTTMMIMKEDVATNMMAGVLKIVDTGIERWLTVEFDYSMNSSEIFFGVTTKNFSLNWLALSLRRVDGRRVKSASLPIAIAQMLISTLSAAPWSGA